MNIYSRYRFFLSTIIDTVPRRDIMAVQKNLSLDPKLTEKRSAEAEEEQLRPFNPLYVENIFLIHGLVELYPNQNKALLSQIGCREQHNQNQKAAKTIYDNNSRKIQIV